MDREWEQTLRTVKLEQDPLKVHPMPAVSPLRRFGGVVEASCRPWTGCNWLYDVAMAADHCIVTHVAEDTSYVSVEL